jgi:hypothetical protein
VRDPNGRSWRSKRRERWRSGRESDKAIVRVKPLTTVKGRGLTSGALSKRKTVRGHWPFGLTTP